MKPFSNQTAVGMPRGFTVRLRWPVPRGSKPFSLQTAAARPIIFEYLAAEGVGSARGTRLDDIVAARKPLNELTSIPEKVGSCDLVETIDPALLLDHYRFILERGLMNLRRYSVPDRFDYLNIEIDHLHNIPSYMQDDNVFRHAYYFCTERPRYIERLNTMPEIRPNFIFAMYRPHWEEIRQLLLPYAAAVNAKTHLEKL